MLRYIVLLLLSCGMWGHALSAIPPLRKLTVTSSNNHLLDRRYGMIPLPPSVNTPYFRALRQRAAIDSVLRTKDELAVIRALRHWTSMQWEHDGRFAPSLGISSLQILEQCAQGARFNCEGYARVLLDMLLAHGIVARVVYLKTKEAPYAAPGQGHVAVCAWSDQMQRWVFLDPQFDGEVSKNGALLSWIDVADVVRSGDTAGVEFRSTKATTDVYRSFLSAYTGYVSSLMLVEGNTELVTYRLDTTAKQYFTFQGLPADGTMFTEKRHDFNMPLNGTALVFYSSKPQDYQRVLSKYKIITTEDYMHYMSLFTATPDFTIRLTNAMPWFKTYEVSVDGGAWKTVRGNRLPVHFHDGSNDLRVRAVNEFGWPGPVTSMIVQYE
ncbi:MAG: hypothetical protein JSS89_07735 [Bacteroidetes bacterium]|nr:hypothetical protein [Bacteroidota bacterium]